jgi:Ca-activated chloride channel family protein
MNNDPILSGLWFSLNWFSPQQLLAYSFGRPLFLYAIGFIPLVFIFRFLIYNNFRFRFKVAPVDGNMSKSWTAWLRFVPGTLLSLALACVLLALSRPQTNQVFKEQLAQGIDIVLALDVSESMGIEDLQPNRLEAAKGLAKKFISERRSDRIGLVAFAAQAYSVMPLTTDKSLLAASLNTFDFTMIEQGGTAIGNALGVSINRLRSSESKSKVILIISDGNNTAGNIDPNTASTLAKAFQIKIYSILIGKAGRVPFGKNADGTLQMIDNSVDESTLKTVARLTDGKLFKATDNAALLKVFQEIDKLETSPVKVNSYTIGTDYYAIYSAWALVFIALWLFSKATFMGNILED